VTKLIGYARVSTRQQSTDRQQVDILAAGVRRDDLYVDHGICGTRASRPDFDRALDALEAGDTLVITTLDRLGRSTQNMLAFAQELRGRGAGLRVLNLGGGDVDTATPMGSMLLTIMAALGQMEHEIKRERVIDSITELRAAGKDLGGRPRIITDSQIRNARRLIEGGEPAAQVARDLGMSRAAFYRWSRILGLLADQSDGEILKATTLNSDRKEHRTTRKERCHRHRPCHDNRSPRSSNRSSRSPAWPATRWETKRMREEPDRPRPGKHRRRSRADSPPQISAPLCVTSVVSSTSNPAAEGFQPNAVPRSRMSSVRPP
jgi:DNA invertase Pin-like site-specific DNA recombinase